MFILYADKTKLILRRRETVASGSVNVCPVRFEFSADWDGMKRTAVFKAGGASRSVLLDESGECSIPWELLEDPGIRLYAGVYGTRDGGTALPTVWADLGMILTGAAPGEDARTPSPELWQQELDRKQDALRGRPGQLVGFNEEGKAEAVDMGSVEEGTLCQFGHGLKRSGNLISVDTADGFDGDKTLPITAAAVETAVGNIEILLETI